MRVLEVNGEITPTEKERLKQRKFYFGGCGNVKYDKTLKVESEQNLMKAHYDTDNL